MKRSRRISTISTNENEFPIKKACKDCSVIKSHIEKLFKEQTGE